MRKFHKKKILELVAMLKEACTEIEHLLFNNEISSLLQLLSDSQNCSIQIGGIIEKFEGEGTQTVAYIETVCDLFYNLHEEIEAFGSDKDLIPKLKEQISTIENSVTNDIQADSFEMLFIPYKASMWDSMESVWLAAKNDPRCDAIVMPIPYFDRLPQGRLGQMHDESLQYPDYVPITHWQKYSVEERQPDVIVTHNPYDNSNLVTSIHPMFYNERLKNFTDLLFYIPYFACIEDVPLHFCVCPGTVYADKVSVQSEKIRQTYIREFHKMEGTRGKGAIGSFDYKFLVAGSPKFDKAINTKREDCLIPEQWNKLIFRPNGTRKKVILYNTTITGLLEGNEQVLEKLRSVFDLFKHKADEVLLWRPHPLNVVAYESMRPQLLKRYLDMVNEYQHQGYGIYDDTADLHRAVAISDAYYGDWSSLVAIYQCTGKPVMIQDLNIVSTDSQEGLMFENLYDDGSNLWCTAQNYNALFRIDKQTWLADFMGCFPEEKQDGYRLYASITENDDKLYFAPCSAKHIGVYDKKKKVFSHIKLNILNNRKNACYQPEKKFYSIARHKHWVFLVPFTYPALIRYDTLSGELDYYSDWYDASNSIVSNLDSRCFKGVCVNGSYIYAASAGTNAVMVFDMDTCRSKVHQAGSVCYSDICYDGSHFWLLPRWDGALVRWNPASGECKEYNDLPGGNIAGELNYWGIVYADSHVWLLPFRAKAALKINTQSEEISIAAEYQAVCDLNCSKEREALGNYTLSVGWGEKIYAHTGKTSVFIAHDYKMGCHREEPILLSQESIYELREKRCKTLIKEKSACATLTDFCIIEQSGFNLEDLVYYITELGDSEPVKKLLARQAATFRRINKHSDGTSGSAIYSYCMHRALS